MSVVRGFARYWSATDPMTEIPPEGLLPYRHLRAKPYLYSDEQVHHLLEAAKNMPATHSLQPWTYHCLLGLLTVTGLRISEALNLRSTDVDWSQGILTIRNSKFGKSRLIPLHASSLKILFDYGARRDRLFADRKTPYFFCSRYDGRLDEGQVRRVFYTISRQIGIRGPSASRGPRLVTGHDLLRRPRPISSRLSPEYVALFPPSGSSQSGPRRQGFASPLPLVAPLTAPGRFGASSYQGETVT